MKLDSLIREEKITDEVKEEAQKSEYENIIKEE